jgi:predicted ATPase
MTMRLNRRVLLVGGPGSGKTTVLDELAGQGYTCVPDNARIVIRTRKLRGLTPRPDPPEFAYEVLRMDIERYRSTPAERSFVFFERGVPDAVGALDALGVLSPADVGRYLAEFAYCRRVMVFPPWEGIYTTDAERDQTFEESVRVHAAVRDWYGRCGFELVEVARAPAKARCEFILGNLTALDR